MNILTTCRKGKTCSPRLIEGYKVRLNGWPVPEGLDDIVEDVVEGVATFSGLSTTKADTCAAQLLGGVLG